MREIEKERKDRDNYQKRDCRQREGGREGGRERETAECQEYQTESVPFFLRDTELSEWGNETGAKQKKRVQLVKFTEKRRRCYSTGESGRH